MTEEGLIPLDRLTAQLPKTVMGDLGLIELSFNLGKRALHIQFFAKGMTEDEMTSASMYASSDRVAVFNARLIVIDRVEARRENVRQQRLLAKSRKANAA